MLAARPLLVHDTVIMKLRFSPVVALASIVIGLVTELVPAVAAACPAARGACGSSCGVAGYVAALGVGLLVGMGSVRMEKLFRR